MGNYCLSKYFSSMDTEYNSYSITSTCCNLLTLHEGILQMCYKASRRKDYLQCDGSKLNEIRTLGISNKMGFTTYGVQRNKSLAWANYQLGKVSVCQSIAWAKYILCKDVSLGQSIFAFSWFLNLYYTCDFRILIIYPSPY
jgi:hypothetical protein